MPEPRFPSIWLLERFGGQPVQLPERQVRRDDGDAVLRVAGVEPTLHGIQIAIGPICLIEVGAHNSQPLLHTHGAPWHVQRKADVHCLLVADHGFVETRDDGNGVALRMNGHIAHKRSRARRVTRDAQRRDQRTVVNDLDVTA